MNVHFRPGMPISIVKLTNNKYQFSFINNENLIDWEEEDYVDDSQIRIKCDMMGLKIVSYLTLKEIATALNPRLHIRKRDVSLLKKYGYPIPKQKGFLGCH